MPHQKVQPHNGTSKVARARRAAGLADASVSVPVDHVIRHQPVIPRDLGRATREALPPQQPGIFRRAPAPK